MGARAGHSAGDLLQRALPGAGLHLGAACRLARIGGVAVAVEVRGADLLGMGGHRRQRAGAQQQGEGEDPVFCG